MEKLSRYQRSKIDQGIIISDKRILVLIDVSSEKNLPLDEFNRNVYLVDNDYNIIWQIKGESQHTKVAKEQYPNDIARQDDMFVRIYKDDKGEFFADRFHGEECQISIETGEAKRIGWHK